MVVAALDDDKAFAVFGSTFAALAKTRNLAGFVVDGSVRDLSDLKRLAFPTFARGTAPGSAGGHYRIDGANVPVQCGGIEVGRATMWSLTRTVSRSFRRSVIRK